jgi:fatty-acyl-CoA synthase
LISLAVRRSATKGKHSDVFDEESDMQSNKINVGQWISKWAAIRPEKIALYSDGRPFTYRVLNGRSVRVANLLNDLGVVKGDRVGALLYNSNEYIEVYFALSRMGAILVPINWRLVPAEVEFILNDSGATALFFGSEFTDLVGKIRGAEALPIKNFVCIGDRAPSWAVEYEKALEVRPTVFPSMPTEVEGEDANIIMYTSGTTGVPKGAILSHRKTFFNILNANIFYGLTHEDVMLIPRPLFHSGGLLVEALPTLYKGGTIITQKRFRPVEMLKAIETYKVTVAEPPATTLRTILEQCDLGEYDLSSVKCWFTGGERVPPSLIKDYKERGITISQIYGQTETSTIAWLPVADAHRKIGSVGIPVFHGDVRVVNKDGDQVRPGEIGEIVVSGHITMSGYWGKPELTKDTIKNGWLHTGDLAMVDEEGFFYVVDREKDMFISGGENVYPAEIEKVYLENPKVLNVACVGVPDKKWGEVGMLAIVLKDGETMSDEEALTFCDGKLARYKMPKLVRFLPELPMTAAQKIKRNDLRDAYLKEQTDRK